MAIWKYPPEELTLEALNARSKDTIAEWIGIEFTEVGENSVTARMPVDHRTKQPIGLMHGGSSCVLAETVGSTAANMAVDSNLQYCVGLSIDTSHLRSAREGFVIGRAEPIHIGRTTQVWHIEIKDESGKMISDTRLTMAVLIR